MNLAFYINTTAHYFYFIFFLLFWKGNFPAVSTCTLQYQCDKLSRSLPHFISPWLSPSLSFTGAWFSFSSLTALINHLDQVSGEVCVCVCLCTIYSMCCRKDNTVWPACGCAVPVPYLHELIFYGLKYVLCVCPMGVHLPCPLSLTNLTECNYSTMCLSGNIEPVPPPATKQKESNGGTSNLLKYRRGHYCILVEH